MTPFGNHRSREQQSHPIHARVAFVISENLADYLYAECLRGNVLGQGSAKTFAKPSLWGDNRGCRSKAAEFRCWVALSRKGEDAHETSHQSKTYSG